MSSRLALRLSRRVLLKAASGVVLASGCNCGEGAVSSRPPEVPPYPLDTDGDDEMSAPATTHFNKLYDPMFLFAQCTVSPQAGGAPNVAGLMNPHGLPMELLEVRWRLYPNNNVTTFTTMTGAAVGVKLDMGDIPIVDANVPLTSFGTLRDTADRMLPDRLFPDPADTAITAFAATYKWRLKHPLFVPPGCVVTPTFSHMGQNQFPAGVQTLYICRTLPANYTPPQQLYAPWVGSYNSIAFDNLASQAAGKDFSSELDLVNPFKQPLELARITGSCAGVFNGSSSQDNVEVQNYFRYQLAKIRIRSRSGDELARNKTPFNGLFPYGWRAWDIAPGWTLRSGEFYKVQLTVDATSATAPDDDFLGSISFSMGLTAFRKLPSAVFITAAHGGTP